MCIDLITEFYKGEIIVCNCSLYIIRRALLSIRPNIVTGRYTNPKHSLYVYNIVSLRNLNYS